MIIRSNFSQIVLAVLAILVLNQDVSARPPPVDFPQACTSSYCVQVIPTYPNVPGRISIESTAFMGDASLIMDLGDGLVIAFSSKYVDRRLHPAPGEARWQRDGSKAISWACLKCGAMRGKDAVLGIAVTGIPSSYDAELYGLKVCFWPLDLAAAGHGDGKNLRLGDRVCIRGEKTGARAEIPDRP